MDKFSQIGSQEITSIEDLYQTFLNNPKGIDESWRNFFTGFEFALKNYSSEGEAVPPDTMGKEFKVMNLIQGYRQRGHLFSGTNPVRTRRKYSPTLDIENFGLESSDLETIFHAGAGIGIGPAKLKDIIGHLKQTYCGSVGAEYMYMRSPELIQWLQSRMEQSKNSMDFSVQKRRHIYYHLKLAVGFENYIHKKFVGQKRFSLEGAENLVPALDAVIERGAELGIEEFVIGMSHRGRLNVLANILQKPYENIFKEFYGTEYEEDIASGDVKYHLGYENTITSDEGHRVKISLVPNPSHLETVNGIVEGLSRSKIDSAYQGDYNKLAPILIHGDAAIAAQGIVYEVIQMSLLDGYKTGGTIHLVINNQVGFTTNYLDARSSTYCTDVAKVTRCPVFHVNGDDVEALIYTIRLAMEFRQHFHNDVFIDILCYRKYGHNEGDEPRFTQPTLYKAIAMHPNPRDIYAHKLTQLGIMTEKDVEESILQFNDLLEHKYQESERIEKLHIRSFLVDNYKNYRLPVPDDFLKRIDTSVSKETLYKLADRVNTLPDSNRFFAKAERLIEERRKMVEDNSIDWAMGELLAYASLVNEGHPIRLSGQDSERGTFAHRHAAFVVEDTDMRYFPLKNIREGQAPFHVYNSLLSEYGVLGFEYGYALAQPEGLTIWEAQFGDFSNVAQVIFDQYISSAGEKWGLMCGLTLFLPHGFEGQGPEHSSARIERILSLAAQNNMTVVQPTTPGNLFHALRRQVKWNLRIPMIVITPKSLLRHARVRSPLEELSEGAFRELIDDSTASPDKVTDIIFTSGRLYFDLLKQKEELNVDNYAIVRIEQLYPFPHEQVQSVFSKYPNATRKVWAQDEPENMGVWPFLLLHKEYRNFEIVSRRAGASPAVGLPVLHNQQLKNILDRVFKLSEQINETMGRDDLLVE